MTAAASVAALAAVLSVTSVSAQDTEKVAAKGRVVGGKTLLNPVWNEAKDSKSHRYTFRAPSTTVGKQAKQLTAYLPKELAIVVLTTTGKASAIGKPIQIGVSGGRTTPVTTVVTEGQNIQFVNHDPFPHKLYDVGKVANGLGPEETKPSGQRIWKPPKEGVYEIRDEYFPSVRSWIVVEPRAVTMGSVNFKNEFIIGDLSPGQYELQGYFSGKPVGKPLKIELRGAPEVQTIRDPLVVGTPKSKASKK